MTCLGCNGCVVVDRSCVVGPSRGETRGEKRGETHGDKRGEKRRRNTRRKTAKHAATNAGKNCEQRRIPDTCLISGRRKTRRKTATHAAKNAAKNGLPRTSTSHLTRRPTNKRARFPSCFSRRVSVRARGVAGARAVLHSRCRNRWYSVRAQVASFVWPFGITGRMTRRRVASVRRHPRQADQISWCACFLTAFAAVANTGERHAKEPRLQQRTCDATPTMRI